MLARKRTSQSWAACESLGSKGSKTLRSVRERHALVEVVAVLAGPEEGLAAGHVLDVVGDRAARLQDRPVLVPEVVADRADRADLVEERRGEAEVGGGAAEHALARPERAS